MVAGVPAGVPAGVVAGVVAGVPVAGVGGQSGNTGAAGLVGAPVGGVAVAGLHSGVAGAASGDGTTTPPLPTILVFLPISIPALLPLYS